MDRNLMLLVLDVPLIGMRVRLLQAPYRFLDPAILCLICIGVFSISGSTFDVGMVLVFGVLGCFVHLIGFEPAPLPIGFVPGCWRRWPRSPGRSTPTSRTRRRAAPAGAITDAHKGRSRWTLHR